MRIRTTWLASCFILATIAVSGEAAGEVELRVNLIDGSRVVGVPINRQFQVDVSYGTLNVPLARIRKATWKTPGEAQLILQNSDKLTGKLREEPIELKTLFGAIKIQMKHVRSFDVIPQGLSGWGPPEDGLVVHLSFDNKSRIGENSARESLAAKSNNAKWLASGRQQGAVEFDGQSGVQIPDHLSISPSRLSIGAWVYPSDDKSSYRMVAAKTSASSWSGGYGLVRMPGDQQNIHFFVTNYSSFAVKAPIPMNKWSHVLGTWDGKVLTLFVNGESAASRPLQGRDPFGGPAAIPQISHNAGPLRLGRDKSSYAWKGRLDEFVLYNRALSAEEAKDLYESCGGLFDPN